MTIILNVLSRCFSMSSSASAAPLHTVTAQAGGLERRISQGVQDGNHAIDWLVKHLLEYQGDGTA